MWIDVFKEDPELVKRYEVKTFRKEVDGVEKEGFWLLEFDFVLIEQTGPVVRNTCDVDYIDVAFNVHLSFYLVEAK